MNRCRPAAAVVATAVALLAPLPAAQAASSVRAAGDVQFQYSAPEISDAGDHVTWHWNVTNSGAKAAHEVVMTHRIEPNLPITSVSGPCTVDKARAVVTCTWDQLSAGQRADGAIGAELPEDLSGSVHIKGRIVWQESPSGTSSAK
ncbi:DUF11 domain-containing protein [Saccharothrix sp. ST-888]|uniref:DUF11 domain-containing protein n=1 Tax=Saccharothrix sp. ST-888 TaxID=1427391 RepID=UPI0005EC0359|nr:DUF11 domain-containing protein [Saccharothrix sp. ST-888]KJK58391.1 hypothetical protein UK12_10775 [Saccharothrix sp. ST-888]